MKAGRKYQTLLVIVTGLLVLWYFKRSDVLLYSALGTGLAGVLVPPLATAIDWLWYKLARAMGAVMSRVILSLFFFLFLTPIAFLRKVFSKKDPMQLRKEYSSLWTSRNHAYTAKDLENPW